VTAKLDIVRDELDGHATLRIASGWAIRRFVLLSEPEIDQLCKELQRLFPEHFVVPEGAPHSVPPSRADMARAGLCCASCGAVEPDQCPCTQEQRQAAWEKAEGER